MTPSKVLLVDDTDAVLHMMEQSLSREGFDVITAASVTEALSQIVTQQFDVLITDLHMPEPGDGFAVVTAMRHSQPNALTLVVSGFPDVEAALDAVLLQADEVLVKPLKMKELAELIRKKAPGRRRSPKRSKESVANILERDAILTIQRWLSRVKEVEDLAALPLADVDRTDHLREIIKNIAERLRTSRSIEVVATPSPAAVSHGQLRYRQGYTAPMLVQESRILQVCIFETIQRNLAVVDFSSVLPDIMLLADEVDSQLTQSIDSYLRMQKSMTA
jgi:YesN/AraC family two-component response regulator